MKLPTPVKFIDEETGRAFARLKHGDDADRKLHKWILDALQEINQNAFVGIQFPKRLIPKEYRDKVANLWKYNLPKGWRLLYTIAEEEILVMTIILEWLPHKKYERRFKY